MVLEATPYVAKRGKLVKLSGGENIRKEPSTLATVV